MMALDFVLECADCRANISGPPLQSRKAVRVTPVYARNLGNSYLGWPWSHSPGYLIKGPDWYPSDYEYDILFKHETC